MSYMLTVYRIGLCGKERLLRNEGAQRKEVKMSAILNYARARMHTHTHTHRIETHTNTQTHTYSRYHWLQSCGQLVVAAVTSVSLTAMLSHLI